MIAGDASLLMDYGGGEKLLRDCVKENGGRKATRRERNKIIGVGGV